MTRWTRQDVTRHELRSQQFIKGNKFRNVKKTVNGIPFDSTKEANRYLELAILQAAKEIIDLEVHPRFDLIASNGEIIGHYTADFRYFDVRLGRLVVEDVKAACTKTEAYGLRKRLMRACHGIAITEV